MRSSAMPYKQAYRLNYLRILYAMPSPPICSIMAQTCVSFRCYWVTVIYPPPKFTPTWPKCVCSNCMPRITLALSPIFIHHLRPRSVNEPGFFFVMLGDQFLSIAKRKGYLCHLPAQKFLLHALWQAA